MAGFNFFFNKIKYQLNKKEDFTLIQIAEILGLVIPRFCYHNSLSIAGNCRMCLIEVNTSLKPIVACGFSLTNNLQIFTNTKRISIIRESILELLLVNHPLDCPICDSAGECDLQDISLLFGNDLSRFKERKRTVSDKNFGSFIKTIMTRCIHCTRCIRFIDEYIFKNSGHIGTLGRGVNTIVSNYFNHPFENDLSGNLADLCPVGALTHKTYAFTARPWELHTVEYRDFIENVTMNIRIDLKGNDIYRIIPIYTAYMQDEFISNKTRYFYDSTFNKKKNFSPLYLYKDIFVKNIKNISWDNMKFHMNKIKNSIFTYSINDLYTTNILKKFTLIFDLKHLNSKTNDINLRKSYIKHSYDLHLSNTLLLENIDLKIQSTMLDLKLSKLKKDITYIGNYISNINNNHIGITTKVKNKVHNAQLTNVNGLKKNLYSLLFSNNKKKKNNYFLNRLYIPKNTTISQSEIGILSHYVTTNKYINKNLIENSIQLNDNLEMKNDFTKKIILTHFSNKMLNKIKEKPLFNIKILIPTINNFSQNISFWNIFGTLIQNNQIIKSNGYDDYSIIYFLIKNHITKDKNVIKNEKFKYKKIISLVISQGINIGHLTVFLYIVEQLYMTFVLSTFNYKTINNRLVNDQYLQNSKYLNQFYIYENLMTIYQIAKYSIIYHLISYNYFQETEMNNTIRKGTENYFDYFKSFNY